MILASSSPQRHRLIKYIDKEIRSLSVEVDETFSKELSAYDNVMEVAKNKALAVIEKYKIDNDIVVGCDTIVLSNGKVLTKPTDYNNAFEMISSYKNSDVEVVSGVCVSYIKNGKINSETFVECSWVTFEDFSDNDIEKWLQEDDYLGCSGAIKIEKIDKYFKVNIEGSISNIIGLPLEKLTALYIAHMSDDRFPTLYEDIVETPVVRVRSTSRVIPYDGENVYFLKQVDRSKNIGYALIGGGCVLNENLLEAGKREVHEETGIVIDELEPIGVSYIYHERDDKFLGRDKFWYHQFISKAKIIDFEKDERLEYEKEMIKAIVKMSIDEAIKVFTEQNKKYKNTENEFFFWFNKGVIEALTKMHNENIK